LGILGGAIVLFTWGRPRVDLVALLVVLALILSRVLTQREAFAGFGDPVVVLIAATFIVGEALVKGRVSNSATAVLISPIAIDTAQTLHVSLNVGFDPLSKQIDPVDTGVMDRPIRLAIVQVAPGKLDVRFDQCALKFESCRTRQLGAQNDEPGQQMRQRAFENTPFPAKRIHEVAEPPNTF
jgi:hypothetical protein